MYDPQLLEKSSRPCQTLPLTPIPGPNSKFTLVFPLCPLILTAAQPEREAEAGQHSPVLPQTQPCTWPSLMTLAWDRSAGSLTAEDQLTGQDGGGGASYLWNDSHKQMEPLCLGMIPHPDSAGLSAHPRAFELPVSVPLLLGQL